MPFARLVILSSCVTVLLEYIDLLSNSKVVSILQPAFAHCFYPAILLVKLSVLW